MVGCVLNHLNPWGSKFLAVKKLRPRSLSQLRMENSSGFILYSKDQECALMYYIYCQLALGLMAKMK